MPVTLITGANRGLGLEFVRQYAADGWRVHACCRRPQEASALQSLAKTHDNIHIHRLDVGEFEAIRHLADELRNTAIDVLISNAGIYLDRDQPSFGNANVEMWLEEFRINTIAPLKLAEAFLEHVAASEQKKLVFITSKMGSMADNGSGGAYFYRSSKAALNAVAKSLSIDLAPRGILVGLLHPGWVKTDMGGPNAWITPQQSIAGMRRLIERLSPADSGTFYAYDGQIVPW
ncbi:MAG: SDR family oxidoreductase [Methylophilaceae bacterium]|nr:SDR family oxidoreductase [Methylophilaceae bacterium]